MSNDEILRKKLDRLNENSVYGLMDVEKIDRLQREACHNLAMIWGVDSSEIAKIVHSYIERGISCDYDRLNCPKPPIYIGPVKLMTLRDRIIEESAKELQNKVDKLILKEEDKMKATSVQNIKNVKDISFKIENDPVEMESKLTIVATTNDDIFAFEFEDMDLIQSCKRAGLFAGLEKDQKIRELEEELSKWKKEAADCLRLRDKAEEEINRKNKEINEYEEKIKKLKHDDEQDKEAADYWSKEHDILLERFAKLQNENEKLKDKLENVEPFRALEQTIREKQQLKEENEKLKKQLNAVQLMLDDFRKDHGDIIKTQREKHQDEIEQLKQQLQQVKRDKKELTGSYERLNSCHKGLLKDFHQLQDKLALEKAANEAQHKFIREYAGKGTEVQFNYAICAEGECDISYTIVHTDDYAKLKELEEELSKWKKLNNRLGNLVQENMKLREENKFKCDSRSFPPKPEEMYMKVVDDLKKENEDLKKRYDRLNKKFNRVINDNLQENKHLKQENGELKYMLNDIKFTKDLTEMCLNTRAGILDQAKKCVCGHREQDYGTPESNFQLIADLWNGYLGEKTDNPVISVTPVDVSMMMALMKIARIRNGGGSGDSFVDLAGYAACGGEIWHGQKVKDQN